MKLIKKFLNYGYVIHLLFLAAICFVIFYNVSNDDIIYRSIRTNYRAMRIKAINNGLSNSEIDVQKKGLISIFNAAEALKKDAYLTSKEYQIIDEGFPTFIEWQYCKGRKRNRFYRKLSDTNKGKLLIDIYNHTIDLIALHLGFHTAKDKLFDIYGSSEIYDDIYGFIDYESYIPKDFRIYFAVMAECSYRMLNNLEENIE